MLARRRKQRAGVDQRAELSALLPESVNVPSPFFMSRPLPPIGPLTASASPEWLTRTLVSLSNVSGAAIV